MSQIQTDNRITRGWANMVNHLNAANDVGSFHYGMLDLQCKIVAAEYGMLWLKSTDNKPELAASWPSNLAKNPQQAPVYELLEKAAQGGFERQNSHVLKITPENAQTAENTGAHVFVTILRTNGEMVGVMTVVAECKDPSVLQTTMPLRELGAGLYETFCVKQQALGHAREAQQIRSAMGLLAVSQEAEGFYGAAMNLVNELARQLKCSRVSIGWVKGNNVRLIAMSDTEELKAHSHAVLQIEAAMSECLDQEQPIVCPIPQDAEPLLAEAVIFAHKELIAQQPNCHVLSVALRLRDQWLGVLMLERIDEGFTPDMVTQMQLVADVVAPHMDDRKNSDRWLIGHAWGSVEWAASYLIGPKHVGWKLLSLLIFAVLMIAMVVRIPYKVSADFTLEALEKRIIPAPYEAHLLDVQVRPGDPVTSGQVLAHLNATELKLQLADAKSQLHIYLLDAQKARAEEKQADAQVALANAQQVRAKIKLLAYQIEQSTIRTPIAGIVLSGDWYDKVGGVIKLGDPMFEVAPLDKIIAKLRINESDIDDIGQFKNREKKLPQGALATRALPEQRFNFTLTQIIPLAVPIDQKNVFEVRAIFGHQKWDATKAYLQNDTAIYKGVRYRAVRDISQSDVARETPSIVGNKDWIHANWLRPGMEGIARINVGDRHIYWIATHRVTDAARLWLWW